MKPTKLWDDVETATPIDAPIIIQPPRESVTFDPAMFAIPAPTMTDGQMIVGLFDRLMEMRIQYDRDPHKELAEGIVVLHRELSRLIDGILDGKAEPPEPNDY